MLLRILHWSEFFFRQTRVIQLEGHLLVQRMQECPVPRLGGWIERTAASSPSSIQSDSGGKFNILGGNSIGHCEKKVHMNMCLILTGNRDRAV